jgi:hypothetical protein
MSINRTYPTIERYKVLTTLASIWREWKEAANGENLVEIEGRVGLILWDVMEGIGLTEQEMYLVTGLSLFPIDQKLPS